MNLNRNSESTTTGIFRCDIPDASGVTQSLYVGIYTGATGEFYMLSEGLEISDKDSTFQVFVINPYAKQVLPVHELQYVWHTQKLIQHLLAAMIISYFL